MCMHLCIIILQASSTSFTKLEKFGHKKYFLLSCRKLDIYFKMVQSISIVPKIKVYSNSKWKNEKMKKKINMTCNEIYKS